MAANMLKKESKRRRTKKQVLADEEAALAEDNANRANKVRLFQVEADLNQTQQELDQTQQQAAINRDAATLVGDLIKAGIVKESGPGSFVI